MKVTELFDKQSIVLLDGALGTQFQKRGLAVGAMPEKLNTENPDLVYAVTKEYADAGSDVVFTNIFARAATLSAQILSAQTVRNSATSKKSTD